MERITKGFLLFPDDIQREQVKGFVYNVNSDEWKRRGCRLSAAQSISCLNLATNIASGHTDMSSARAAPATSDQDKKAQSLVLSGGRKGGLFIYHWSTTDRLVLPVIDDRLVLSRGDLEWIDSYPFIEGLDLNERTVSLHPVVTFTNHSLSPSLFLTSRVHFGHLARDTIAQEAYIAAEYLKQNGEKSIEMSFSHLPINDKYLENQLEFSLRLLFPKTDLEIKRLNHPHIEPGTSLLLYDNLMFIKSIGATFPCYDMQNFLSANVDRPSRGRALIHLGITGSPHRRIKNAGEFNKYMEDRGITSIDPAFSPSERYSLLRNAQVVISEPSSSLYNYILNCSLDTICILLLPGTFKKQPTRRDCCDWSFILRHLISRKIIPFFSVESDQRDCNTMGPRDRYIDIPNVYDLKSLDNLVEDISERVQAS